MDEEERLIEEAHRSQQATEELREEGTTAEPEETESSDDPGIPGRRPLRARPIL
jgi:hypothetical protein